MKKLCVLFLVGLMAFSTSVQAWQPMSGDYQFKGIVDFEHPIQIDEISMTASATELNSLVAERAATNSTGTYTAQGNVSVGDGLVPGYLRTYQPVVLVPGTSNVVNGSIITASKPAWFISTTAGLGITNTIADPRYIGQRLTLANSGTNVVTFIDGGNLALTSDYGTTQNDTLSLMSLTTNLWLEVFRSAN